MPHTITELLDLLILCLNARFKCTFPRYQVSVLRRDLVILLSLLLVRLQLHLQLLQLPILVLYHLLLALDFCFHLCLLFRFGFCDFEPIHELVVLFFRSHQSHMQVVFLFPLLIENILLLEKGFL